MTYEDVDEVLLTGAEDGTIGQSCVRCMLAIKSLIEYISFQK